MVTLDRPEKRNAINEEMTCALDAIFNRAERDDAVRAYVLAARGDVFCAGTDLITGAGPHTSAGGQYGLVRRARTKPLIVAVDGPALGGGFELVLSADMVVASRRAWFALPETTRGRVPAAGGLHRAPDRLPRNLAIEMMLTNARLGADRARAVGLVNRLAAPGEALSMAMELAMETCRSSPEAVTHVLGGVRVIDEVTEATGWAVTSAAKLAMLDSPDHAEGDAAFIEHRLPAWTPPETSA
ncbi:enoyl-CoA hydratase/isomerase family protein [Aeromicrobium sp. YIM 150415]|nr:enoyl-CoA hydratase/isomerase family protein [Aeromicrobium sp. YIM 150415]